MHLLGCRNRHLDRIFWLNYADEGSLPGTVWYVELVTPWAGFCCNSFPMHSYARSTYTEWAWSLEPGDRKSGSSVQGALCEGSLLSGFKYLPVIQHYTSLYIQQLTIPGGWKRLANYHVFRASGRGFKFDGRCPPAPPDGNILQILVQLWAYQRGLVSLVWIFHFTLPIISIYPSPNYQKLLWSLICGESSQQMPGIKESIKPPLPTSVVWVSWYWITELQFKFWCVGGSLLPPPAPPQLLSVI